MSVTFSAAGHFDLDDPNYHNAGAAALLDLLGYPVESDGMGGVANAEVFIGRVLIALALLDNASADAEGLPTRTEGRFIEGARPPGYLAHHLQELKLLGERAQQLGVAVSWG